jgi:hypothetical protein
MAVILRGMYRDGDGPQVGGGRNCLGVRPDEITLVNGMVLPEKRRGMSVRPSIAAFPPGLVPVRLRGRYPGALNEDGNYAIWSMGEGPFEEGPIHADYPALILRPDKKSHGTVGPREPVELAVFQQSLAGTRPLWSPVE